MARLIRPS